MNNITNTSKSNLGVTIKIYTFEDFDNTALLGTVNKILNEIYENIKAFTEPRLFSDLIIELWNDKRSDFPKEMIPNCGEILGLNLMKVRVSNDTTEKGLHDILSHEFGHQWSFYVGFNDINSIMRREWDRLRGIDETIKTPKVELIAEDFRIIFGSSQAKYLRGDQKSALSKKGLIGLMKIWQKVTNYQKALPFYIYISNTNSSTNINNYSEYNLSITQNNIFIPFLYTNVLFSSN